MLERIAGLGLDLAEVSEMAEYKIQFVRDGKQ